MDEDASATFAEYTNVKRGLCRLIGLDRRLFDLLIWCPVIPPPAPAPATLPDRRSREVGNSWLNLYSDSGGNWWSASVITEMYPHGEPACVACGDVRCNRDPWLKWNDHLFTTVCGKCFTVLSNKR